MSDVGALVRVEGLHAGYGPVKALHGVSLSIREGETVVLLGTNGNGKTTLLLCLAGLLTPTAGRVRFCPSDGGDIDLTALSAERRVELGIVLVPEGRRLFSRSTVEENLRLGAFRPAARPKLRRNLDVCYEIFPVLAERRGQIAGTMSGGEQQMLALARAVMAEPRLLLIDEPSVGLSPLFVKRTMEAIAKLKAHRPVSVLMAEQNFRQAVRIADRGFVIAHGRIAHVAHTAAELADSALVRSAYLGI